MPLPTHPQHNCDPASLVICLWGFVWMSVDLSVFIAVCLSVCLSIYQSVILSFNSIPISTSSLSLLLFAIFLLQDVLSFCVDTLVIFSIIMIRHGGNIWKSEIFRTNNTFFLFFRIPTNNFIIPPNYPECFGNWLNNKNRVNSFKCIAIKLLKL